MRGSIWAALLLAALVVGGMSALDALAQSPQPTDSAGTPVTTPAPADVGIARELERAGDTEGAIAAYRAFLAGAAIGERSDALMELAQLLLAEQPAEAARLLDRYLFEAPEGTDLAAAQFLLAEALRASGDWGEALPLYDSYLAGHEQLETYARLGRAEALARLGRGAEAEVEAEALLEEDIPAAAVVALLRSMAEAFEAGGDVPRSLLWYGKLASAGSPAEQALALWRAALLKVQAGDETWRQDVLTIIQRYPSTHVALEAAQTFVELRNEIDPYYIGLVLYQHGEDEEARTIFGGLVGGTPSPDAARAAYYLAAIDERAGDFQAAVEGYGRVAEIDPDIELADDALWWQGRLLEQDGRREDAVRVYQDLASRFGASDRGREARFRLALLEYDAGHYRESANLYAGIAASVSGEARQRALLWQGKAFAAAGDDETARSVWEGLRDSAPDDYFALRAGVLLDGAFGSVDDGILGAEVTPDWTAIARWLDESDGRSAAPTPSPPSRADKHLRLGRALGSLGLYPGAAGEFELALEAADGDPDDLFGLVRQFHTADVSHGSARAAARLLSVADPNSAPRGLWLLAYPSPFLDEVTDASSESDVPPLLLLAMIRQESFFDPRAGSPAGAIGLTQVIEPTGQAIAQEMGLGGFEIEDLRQPSLSIRFGAHYLASQLDAFGGNFYHALAAYNGGPGNAARWSEVAGEDVDRFVEEIDFAETRLYVMLVSENLARYRALYGGSEEPALPAD